MKKNIKKLIIILSFAFIFTACSTKANENKVTNINETKKETKIETKIETKEFNTSKYNDWFTDLLNFPHGTAGSSLRAVKLLDESLTLSDYPDNQSEKINKQLEDLYNKTENKNSLDMTISLLSNHIKEFKKNPEEYKKNHEDAGVKFENEKNIEKLEILINKLNELVKKSNEKKDVESSSLTNDEKQNIEKFVKELENIPNGTAGSGLQIVGVFYDSLNYATVFESKPDMTITYINSLVNNLNKKKNFLMSLDSLKFQIKDYKKDKQEYINSNKDAGYTWNPSISIEAYENVINNINVQ